MKLSESQYLDLAQVSICPGLGGSLEVLVDHVRLQPILLLNLQQHFLLNPNSIHLTLNALPIDPILPQLIQTITKQRLMQVRKTLHDLLKVHLHQLRLQHLDQPENDLEPPGPSLDQETIPQDPAQFTTHLPPESDGPSQQEVLAFDLLLHQVIEQFRQFPFQHSHELVYSKFEAIEVSCVHAVELVVHEVFEDVVADEGVICQLQNVLAEIVHALKVPMVRVIEGKGVQHLDHLHPQLLIPSQRPPCIEPDYLQMFSRVRYLLHHPLIDCLGEGRLANGLVDLQSVLLDIGEIIVLDEVSPENPVSELLIPVPADQQDISHILANGQVLKTHAYREQQFPGQRFEAMEFLLQSLFACEVGGILLVGGLDAVDVVVLQQLLDVLLGDVVLDCLREDEVEDEGLLQFEFDHVVVDLAQDLVEFGLLDQPLALVLLAAEGAVDAPRPDGLVDHVLEPEVAMRLPVLLTAVDLALEFSESDVLKDAFPEVHVLPEVIMLPQLPDQVLILAPNTI